MSVALILFFVVCTIISIIFSRDFERSVATSLYEVAGLLVFFVIAFGYRGIQDVVLSYAALFLVASTLTVHLLVVALVHLHLEPLEWVEIASVPSIQVPNDISFACLLAPFALGLRAYLNNRKFSWACSGFLVVLAATAAIYRSAVGLLCLTVATAVYAALVKDKRLLTAVLLLLAFSMAADLLLGQPLVDKFIQTLEHGGWDPRFALWLVALGMFFNAPLTGYGPHTFINYYNDALPRLSLPSELVIDTRIVPWPHNLYLELLAERGIVTFFVFAALLVLSIRTSWHLNSRCSPLTRPLNAGLMAALAGFCTGAMVEFTLLRIWVVILFYTMISLVIYLNSLQMNERL